MSWGRPGPRGWGGRKDDESSRGWLLQVIHTIVEVVAGGVIRAGKTNHDDNVNTGFWLGVGSDGSARFSVGGPSRWLKWTGTTVEVKGNLQTPTVTVDDDGLAIVQGDAAANQLRFVDGSAAIATIDATAAGGPWLTLATAQPAATDDVGRLDLEVDGDFGALVRLRLETTKGGGAASSSVKVYFGSLARVTIDSSGHVAVAAAAANGQAVNLGQADGRYVAKSAGWDGTIGPGFGSITVVDGQITAVT